MPVLEPLLALGSLDAAVSGPAVAGGSVAAARAGVTRARDAFEALDLRTIQKLDLDRVHTASATGVIYSGRSSLAVVVAYYKAELAARGWEEQRGPAGAVETPGYAQRFFGKGAFTVQLTVGASGRGDLMIALGHLGDLDLNALPRPEGARPMGEPRRMAITYATPRGIAGAAAGCRRALVARGWHAFESFNASGGGTPCPVDFTVVKGASVVFVSVAEGRGEHAGPTIVTYRAQPILAVELPIADDASEVKLNALAGRVEYRSHRFRTALAAFYRDAYRSAGFGETTPRGSGDGALIFDGAGTRLSVQITELTTGGRRVAVDSSLPHAGLSSPTRIGS
jgi:hypothetical protein